MKIVIYMLVSVKFLRGILSLDYYFSNHLSPQKSRLKYDYRDITYGAFATINVANGRRGTYYIGIVASIHSQCHVTLRATVEGTF